MTQAVDPSSPRGTPAGGGGTAGMAALVGVLAGLLLTAGSALAVRSWTGTATQHLMEPEKEKPKVAIADQAEVAYCTPQFKQVLERVLHSCGLAAEGEGARRGCKPADVKTFASISDDDFNALFTPLKDRDGIDFSLERIMSGIKGASAHSINRMLYRSGGVWQHESFDRVMRRMDSVHRTAVYICENPVRKGLVETADDYPHLWRDWVEGCGVNESTLRPRT